ncbi:Smr/MutS family protein [Oryzomonas japonica]|nr:Smr/MutS family protein [Oryzomonas japonica]
MGKKQRHEKPAAAAQFRATPFAALKEVALSSKEPAPTVVPPPQPPPHEAQSVEEADDLFLRAMADVKVVRTRGGGPAKAGTGRERPVSVGPADDGEAELFRRAMAGVKTLSAPPVDAAKPTTARTGACTQVQPPPPPTSGADREAAELFLQEIGRLKLETKFADSLPADEELKPLSGNRLRQVKQGVIAVTHQLDLHGLTREEALAALPRFLNTARRKGQKAALVITGKGINSPGEPVLQQAVASWLRDAGRETVLEFAPAPREMGGSGAFVVFLRPLPEPPAAA